MSKIATPGGRKYPEPLQPGKLVDKVKPMGVKPFVASNIERFDASQTHACYLHLFHRLTAILGSNSRKYKWNGIFGIFRHRTGSQTQWAKSLFIRWMSRYQAKQTHDYYLLHFQRLEEKIGPDSGKFGCVCPVGTRSETARHACEDTQEVRIDELRKILAQPLVGCGKTLGNAVISTPSPVRRRNLALKIKSLRDCSSPAAPRNDRLAELSGSPLGRGAVGARPVTTVPNPLLRRRKQKRSQTKPMA